jgi:hypothetical protein
MSKQGFVAAAERGGNTLHPTTASQRNAIRRIPVPSLGFNESNLKVLAPMAKVSMKGNVKEKQAAVFPEMGISNPARRRGSSKRQHWPVS